MEEPIQPDSQEKKKFETYTFGAWETLTKDFKYTLKSSVLALTFWLIQFLYHFYIVTPGDLGFSLIRSFAFSGATLFGLALLIGPISRLTKYHYIQYRRAAGVWAFVFINMHVTAVLWHVFGWDRNAIYSVWNPYINPLIFGSFALWLLIPLFFTSTDWSMRKLGFTKWKMIHRLVYPAYLFSVLHFIQVNPSALMNFSGYLLLGVTTLTIVMQVAGFVKTVRQTKGKTAILVGSLIVIFSLILFYLAYRNLFG